MSHDSHPSTAAAQRIRLARRTAGLSQAQLALELGVQRSAVSHWEAHRGKPSMNHLRQLALLTGVQFEWLATGRGTMLMAEQSQADSKAGNVVLVELAQQLARQRLGPRTAAAKPTTLMHALRLRLGDDPGPIL